jgi:LacI family transcriptional regulator
MRATIRDVALRAGVSKSTVSHVVNGTRFVETETKARVLQAIADLGYRPSTVARSLTTNRTHTIGVIVSDTSNHFFGELIRGIERVMHPARYNLVVCNTDETLEREEHYLNLLLAHQVDGIIAAATTHRWEAVESAALQQCPIVFVDRHFEGLDDYPYIGVDNAAGAYEGTRHLIRCGYRDIGILAGFQRLSSMRERLEGFQRALEEQNIRIPDSWVATSPLGAEAGREAARQLLSLPQRPRAIFVNNNFLSLGALLAIQDLKLRCPEDIALVGFDDHPWAVVTNPPLTVIRQPVCDLGEQSARLLLGCINGDTPVERRTMLKCELIVRKSCGYQPSMDGTS